MQLSASGDDRGEEELENEEVKEDNEEHQLTNDTPQYYLSLKA